MDEAIESNNVRIERLKYEDPDLIIDNLYLGGESSAIDLDKLKEKNITRIVVAAEYSKVHFPQSHINYLKLEIDDDEQEDILSYLDKVINFIKLD